MTVEVTEIVQLDASRVDAVKNPANGFPILLMKQLDTPAAVVAETTTTKDAMSETEVKNEPASTPVMDAGAKPDFVEKSAVDELVKSAVAEASKSLEERITAAEAENQALKDELAKVLKTPLPGGPAYTATTPAQTSARKSQLADADRFERLADTVSDAELRTFYKSRAAALRQSTGV